MSPALRSLLCIAVALLVLAASTSAAQDDPSKQVDALIAKYVHDDSPSMAVLVIKDGQIVHSKGYGLANIAKKTPITPETNFELASVSKQFTAMAIMLLNDRGKLSFDDDVRKHLPTMPAYDAERPIRIRDLLTHTSGLPGDYPYDLPSSQDVFKWFLKAKKPLAYPTGTKHLYSNLGYVLLSLVVESAGGKSYNTFLQDEVFGPLGMKGTVAFENPKLSRHGHALGYELLPKIKKFKDADTPESILKRTKGENFQVENSDSCIVGDGSIWSNLDDLARWDEAVRNGKLVKAETWKEALTPPRLPNGKKVDYGFGWGLTTGRNQKATSIWHEGAWGAFNTLNTVDFQEKFCIVILCNVDGFGGYLSTIETGIRDIYLGGKKDKK